MTKLDDWSFEQTTDPCSIYPGVYSQYNSSTLQSTQSTQSISSTTAAIQPDVLFYEWIQQKRPNHNYSSKQLKLLIERTHIEKYKNGKYSNPNNKDCAIKKGKYF